MSTITPSEAFLEALRVAVLSAPFQSRLPDFTGMPSEVYAALFNGHLDRQAQLLWAHAWHAGATWGLARAPARIEVTGCAAPAGGPCRLFL